MVIYLGQYDDARKTYEIALALDPLDPAANGGLGRALYSMGQVESGKIYLMKAIESYRHDGNYLMAAEIDKILLSMSGH